MIDDPIDLAPGSGVDMDARVRRDLRIEAGIATRNNLAVVREKLRVGLDRQACLEIDAPGGVEAVGDDRSDFGARVHDVDRDPAIVVGHTGRTGAAGIVPGDQGVDFIIGRGW